MVTEQQAEAAIRALKAMIEAAENSNQAGEDAVVAAAAGPRMLAALKKVVDWLETEFEGQDEAEIATRDSGLEEARAAIARVEGRTDA